MCWNDTYLIIGLGDQYLGNWHDNVKHISSVVIHFGVEDIHILFPWTCQILFVKYYNHEASQSFYMSQIGD